MRWLILFLGVLASGVLCAQSTDLFDRNERSHLGHGWSWKLGGHLLDATPSSSPSQWLTSNPNGNVDTLHIGTWSHAGAGSVLVGIGHWWTVKDPILWDRWSIELGGVRHAANSEFIGRVAGNYPGAPIVADTLMDRGESVFTLQTALQVHRAIEIMPDFFLDAHIGIGWNREFGLETSRVGADSLFLPLPDPSDWRLAFEGGLGLGVRTQSGRFLHKMTWREIKLL